MSASGSYQIWPAQSMFRHCKTTATRIIRNAKEVSPITHPRPLALLALSGDVTRTVVTMNKDAIDPQQLDAIFQQKQSLRSKIRKDLKNMDPVQRIQEDNVIQNIVLESPWFKASKSLCAYISCATLREVDTSRIVSDILSNPDNGLSEFFTHIFVQHIFTYLGNILSASIGTSAFQFSAYFTVHNLISMYYRLIIDDILDVYTAYFRLSYHFTGNTQIRKKLYVPRIEDRNSNMRMLKISSVNDLIVNSMNILEPALVNSDGNEREDVSNNKMDFLCGDLRVTFLVVNQEIIHLKSLFGAVMQASEPVDLLILPGLAFDRSGRRLGRSGGYYDLFLMKYQKLAQEREWKQPLLVALAYTLQIIEEGAIPVTPYDVPVDAVVTPSGFLPISPAALERCD
ncbi:hypothetical protein JRO89_XS05G0065200 [Xanthoceras sorbifolium]|uniref:5-formyltetrahydrofolate cyclo-ligase n=1 Tax=Xanthoceras sorbifolium TaxID=99658 RepID=A0ABQ8I179_9ROSI|nr:hypothetical protein JRO89_XS05G0065200 [Xanthoceras sorbifolium]